MCMLASCLFHQHQRETRETAISWDPGQALHFSAFRQSPHTNASQHIRIHKTKESKDNNVTHQYAKNYWEIVIASHPLPMLYIETGDKAVTGQQVAAKHTSPLQLCIHQHSLTVLHRRNNLLSSENTANPTIIIDVHLRISNFHFQTLKWLIYRQGEK